MQRSPYCYIAGVDISQGNLACQQFGLSAKCHSWYPPQQTCIAQQLPVKLQLQHLVVQSLT